MYRKKQQMTQEEIEEKLKELQTKYEKMSSVKKEWVKKIASITMTDMVMYVGLFMVISAFLLHVYKEVRDPNKEEIESLQKQIKVLTVKGQCIDKAVNLATVFDNEAKCDHPDQVIQSIDTMHFICKCRHTENQPTPIPQIQLWIIVI